MSHFTSRLTFFIVLAATTLASAADTLYLKNGIYIVVQKTEEKDGQIEYWVGSTKYTIPKSAVEKIEPGDGPPPPRTHYGSPLVIENLTRRGTGGDASRHERLQLPLPKAPRQEEAYWSALRSRIMSGDSVNDMLLAEIEMDHDDHTTGNAYFLAGVMEMQHGDADKASLYFERAIRAMPEQVSLREWHAIALASQARYSDAASELEHASTLQPDSPDVLRLLGMARYDADRTGDAIAAWKRAMELSPDPNTEKLLHKAERELEIEERSSRAESLHFTLHNQGDRTSADLQRGILETLENQYRDLARQFGYEPSGNIVVNLYTQKEFVDITEAPSWAGALNDGKLRIPIGGLTGITPGLEHVLKHELTHSFVASLAGGRCPTWLNEGLAEVMEARSATAVGPVLAQLFHDRKEIPLPVLEAPFFRFSNLQATVAYAESLAAVEYLRNRYGMGEVLRMLQNIGSGMPAEQALRNSTGLDYSDLERRIGEYLAR